MSKTKFHVGDRVVFNQQYGDAVIGDAGTIYDVESGGSVDVGGAELVYIDLDKGGTESCYARRVDHETDNATEHTFKVGDRGKTRDGRPYEVIAVLPADRIYPVVAEIDTDGSYEVETFTPNGAFMKNAQRPKDIMPPKREKVVYLNVYPEPHGHYGYNTEADARHAAAPGALIVAHKIVIELP